MSNDDFEKFLQRGSNYFGGAPEFYEDTHDEYGNYIGGKKPLSGVAYSTPQSAYQAPLSTPIFNSESPTSYSAPKAQAAYYQSKKNYVAETEKNLNNPPKFTSFTQVESKPKGVPLPGVEQYISPRLYQNIVLYSPRSAADVEQLIAYIKRREPAIVDLDPICDTPDAQRVLDFTSGAVFALNGRIIEIKSNMFLIVPEGIDVAKPVSGV